MIQCKAGTNHSFEADELELLCSRCTLVRAAILLLSVHVLRKQESVVAFFSSL